MGANGWGVALRPADPSVRYGAAVLADNPVAYWRCADSSGSSVIDSSGNGHTGTRFNSPTTGVASPVGQGFAFNGTSQYVLGTTVSNFANALDSAFAFECLLKVASGTTAGSYFAGTVDTGASEFFSVGINGPDSDAAEFVTNSRRTFIHMRTTAGGGALKRWFTNADALPYDDSWHHLAIVATSYYATGGVQIYVDGSAVTTTRSNATVMAPAHNGFDFPIAFGARNNRGVIEHSPVTLSEVALYATGLSAARVGVHADIAGF